MCALEREGGACITLGGARERERAVAAADYWSISKEKYQLVSQYVTQSSSLVLVPSLFSPAVAR